MKNCTLLIKIRQIRFLGLRINDVLSVGVKSIDGILTLGKGQRIGIFAGSGVGKVL